ncbi:hypothetical protein Tco_0286552 [Tanacetum coccineum]
MHPRVPMKREVGSSLRTKDQEALTKPQMLKPNINWAHAQTFTSPQNCSFSTYSSNYQTKLEKALIDFDSHQEKRLSSLRTQLGQQQDDMISKINLLWKTVSEKLDDTPIRNTVGNPIAQMHFMSTNYPTKEDLRAVQNPLAVLSLVLAVLTVF